jgi:murein DD-endopeptidase MepM/ murein hydrolase activator NlpD
MKWERDKLIRYSALALVLVVTMLSLLLWLLLRGDGRLEAGLGMPRTSPTAPPTPTATPAQLRVTPVPTPIRVQVQREYPPDALDLVADGRVLFTVRNAEDGRLAVERYLQESAQLGLGDDQRLIRAGFDQKLSLESPSGRGELLNLEEAVNTLKADESLLPIVRTVVRCVIERGQVETINQENVRLTAGSRIYRNMGVYPYTLSYYETVYRGQAAFSEVKTNEFVVGQGKVDQLVEDGGWVKEAASPGAGPEALPVSGFAPMWPVEGTISTSFGMTDRGMCYGTEISTESVTRVMAPEGGVVVYCGDRGELGLVIDILHDETGCLSRIIGCQRPLVELYQRVKKGEQVAVLPEPKGDTRLVVLRYELLINGLPENPEKYLPKM